MVRRGKRPGAFWRKQGTRRPRHERHRASDLTLGRGEDGGTGGSAGALLSAQLSACRAGRRPSGWRSHPSRCAARPCRPSPAQRLANTVLRRIGSGATSISPLLRSMPVTTAAATSSGRARADAGRQLHFGVREHAGVADEAREHRGHPDAAPAQIRAHRGGEAAQPELGGVVEGGVRRGRLAGERGDEDELAACAARSCAATRPRARTIGARRFTSSTRSTSRDRVVLEPARPRERRVRDEDVDVAGFAEQPARPPRARRDRPRAPGRRARRRAVRARRRADPSGSASRRARRARARSLGRYPRWRRSTELSSPRSAPAVSLSA